MDDKSTGSKRVLAVDRQHQEYIYQTDGPPLGEGSGAVVWLARRLSGADEAAADEVRRVAIKVSIEKTWKGFLAEEARLLHALLQREQTLVERTGGLFRPVRIRSGPEPLRVLDGSDEVLIELEYLDGMTFRRWFTEVWTAGPAPESGSIVDEVLRVARQLAEALVQIQEGSDTPLIHRDIKPDNLMRTSEGLRLFDFNVSRKDAGHHRTNHVGTPGYMAPEVDATEDYDARADLFSVGVVLWEIALRARFNLARNTEWHDGLIRLRWPAGAAADWPPADRDAVGALLNGLVVDRDLRLRSARELLKQVEELEARRRPPAPPPDPFSGLDMVEILTELSPGGLAAVVADSRVAVAGRQALLRSRMQVDDALEDWLMNELSQAALAHAKGPTLFMLAGNAGDGKSHLLQRVVRERMADRPELLARLRVIADATHALRPDGTQHERLAEFFAPFADSGAPIDDRVHVIAMNTGMVIRFFEGDGADQARFSQLYRGLQAHLGLRRSSATEAPPWRIEVVNLDLRDLLRPGPDGAPSFAERMLDCLDPENPESLSAPRWTGCQSCPALPLCPVAFNLRALRMPTPRRAVLHALHRVALDNDVHISPRGLWGFLYRLTTGGNERYDVPDRGGRSPCDVIRAKAEARDGRWLLEGQLTELLFQQAGAGSLWAGLARHDPAFCTASALDSLHTRLSIKTELDNEPKLVAELGGEGRTLAGLSLDMLMSQLPTDGFKGRRRDAAVRRQAIFHAPTLDAWRAHDGAGEFLPLLAAYDAYSRGAATEAHQDELIKLRKLVQAVFLHGHGRELNGQAYLRVSQPNVRAKNMLLVKVDHATLQPIFGVKKIVTPDMHIVAHQQRAALLSLLGYRPNQVTLTIEGVRLTVDLALYEFLRRVSEGQKPTKRAMSQFQALTFVGERLGNRLASAEQTTELFVWDESRGSLVRLAADDFGQPRIHTVR